MKTFAKLILFLLLLAVPAVGRWYWFYPGAYAVPTIATVDDSSVRPVEFDYNASIDPGGSGDGHVVIDLAHNNNLAVDDLTPLQDRLTARGVTVELFDGSAEPLGVYLRRATAYVILAPTLRYNTAEQHDLEKFVADGGRLLLAADPTRPIPPADEEENPFAILFADSAVPAINSVADAFGIVYFADYLYNLVDNEGNYRNVSFTNFSADQPLTAGLGTVVFFAAHSLHGEGIPLIVGDENIKSSLRTGETKLTAAILGAQERVLALGDLTALTPPYHTVADNDRLLSQIADWLAVDARTRDLEDFPYLFQGPVDLVQINGDILDARLVARSESLQDQFQESGLSLTLRAEADPHRDTLLVGTFSTAEPVTDLLARTGITLTVVPEPDEADETAASTAAEATDGTETAVISDTATVPAAGEEPAAEDGAGAAAMPAVGEEEPTAEPPADEETPRSLIEIAGLGKLGLAGTTLYLTERQGERLVLVVLAEDGEQVVGALNRLTDGDFSGCVRRESYTLCSNGEAQEGAGLDQQPEAEPETAAGQTTRIFILVDDNGSGSRTGASELEAILSQSYEITVWRTSARGMPEPSDVEGFDLFIVDSGDYAFDPDDFDPLFAAIGSQPLVLLLGAQPFLAVEADFAPLQDLVVSDAAHPITAGFEPGQVITLAPSESGNPAMLIPQDSSSFAVSQVIFDRGPNSAEAGAPAVVVVDDTEHDTRFMLAPFAFYRLPEAAQQTFINNTVTWFLQESAE